MLSSNKTVSYLFVYVCLFLLPILLFAQQAPAAAALNTADDAIPSFASGQTSGEHDTIRPKPDLATPPVSSGRAVSAVNAACNVPSASYPTIASAIADTSCNPITIAAGTYTENLGINRSVTLNGAGKGVTILDGNNTSHVISLGNFSGMVLNVSGVTIQNGRAVGAGLAGFGGGISNWTTNVVINISDSEFRNNTATLGGAIMHGGGASTITDTDFTNNSSVTSGGAIYNAGGLNLVNTQILNSSSTSGGAIYNENVNGSGILNVMNTLLQGNTASDFGAGIDNRATLNMAHTTLYNNTATVGGGGLYNDATATIYYSTFLSNNGTQGGAINNEGGAQAATVNLHYSTITNNRGNDGSESLGDGIVTYTLTDNATAIANLNHVTLANNGEIGILIADASTNGATTIQANLKNSIVAGGTTADCRRYLNKPAEIIDASGGYNLDQDGTCIAGGGTGNITGNPQLRAAQDNGGQTWTMAPAVMSPVEDVIPVNTNGCGTTDLSDPRGVPVPQDGGCEIGAYERQTHAAPTAVADSYNGIIDLPLTIAANGVITNDLNTQGDGRLVVANTIPTQGGEVRMQIDGGFTYTPSLAFAGVDTFTYTLMDTAGMVAYWPFDEEGGAISTALDMTPNTNDAMLTNGPVYDSDTATLNIIDRYSLNLDGVDDFVTVPDSADLDVTRFSIGGWVKPHSTDAGWQPLFTKQADNGESRAFGLFIIPNTLQLHASFYDGGCSSGVNLAVNSIGSLSVDTWHHVMITYDGAMFAVYIDGALENSVFTNASVCQNDHPVRLGGGESVYSKFDGHMDDIRIYDQALSPADVSRSAGGLSGSTDTAQVDINFQQNCFAETTGDNITDFASNDAVAVQLALDSVSSGLIRLAGTCTGVITRATQDQTVYVAKDIHLQGGYDHEDWTLAPDPVANPTVLDAAGVGRVAYILPTFNVTFENLTLQNGVANGINGAGIYNRATFTLINSIVQNNVQTGALGGGGLYSQAPNTSIISSTIRHNSASISGGGAYMPTGIALIDNSHIFSNTAQFGGGVNSQLQTLIVADSMFEANEAGSLGGGIATTRGTLILGYSSLFNNGSNQGAALNNQEGEVTIQNSTIAENRGGQALTNLRGVDGYVTTIELTHTSVVSNTGTGIENDDTTAAWPAVSPLGYWSFDDESNPTADSSGNSHDGSLINAPVFSTDIPTSIGSGRSLHFSGGSDYVNVSDAADLRLTNNGSNFSLAFWMKADNLSQSQTYLLHRATNHVAVLFEYVDNRVEFFAGTATGDDPRAGSQMAIPDTGWHHVAYTYDGTTLRGYIDGAEKISVAKSFTLSNAAGGWNFGAAAGSTGNFDGRLDDIYIYDQALGQANIQALMKGLADAQQVKVTLSSSVVAHNGTDCVNLSGTLDVSNGYNLDTDGSCVGTGGTGNVTADPLVSAMQRDMGLNQVYVTPLPNSPLIDAIPAGANNCGAAFLGEQLNRTRPVDINCDIGSIELQINYVPTGIVDVYTTTQGISLTVPVAGLLTNDTDGDWDGLTAVIESVPTSGSVAIAPDGSFVYTPTVDFSGEATFTYRASDGSANSDPTTVTIHVVATAVAVDVTVTVSGNDLMVSWNTPAANCGYGVHRSTDPFNGYSPIASDLTMPPYVDAGVGGAMSHYFYSVESSNCGTGSTATSTAVGVFKFALSAGN